MHYTSRFYAISYEYFPSHSFRSRSAQNSPRKPKFESIRHRITHALCLKFYSLIYAHLALQPRRSTITSQSEIQVIQPRISYTLCLRFYWPIYACLSSHPSQFIVPSSGLKFKIIHPLKHTPIPALFSKFHAQS